MFSPNTESETLSQWPSITVSHPLPCTCVTTYTYDSVSLAHCLYDVYHLLFLQPKALSLASKTGAGGGGVGGEVDSPTPTSAEPQEPMDTSTSNQKGMYTSTSSPPVPALALEGSLEQILPLDPCLCATLDSINFLQCP